MKSTAYVLGSTIPKLKLCGWAQDFPYIRAADTEPRTPVSQSLSAPHLCSAREGTEHTHPNCTPPPHLHTGHTHQLQSISYMRWCGPIDTVNWEWKQGYLYTPKPIYKLNKTTGSLEPCGLHAFPRWTQTHLRDPNVPVPHSPWLQGTPAMNRTLLRSTPKGKQEEIWVAQTENTFMGTLQPSLPPLPSLP